MDNTTESHPPCPRDPHHDSRSNLNPPEQLDRGLTLTEATALNMTFMVGIGPFVVIPFVVQAMGGPQCLLAWVLGAVLAALVGVNVGPNLTYVGSLATLLWRRILRAEDSDVDLGEFLRLGALTVPAGIAASTVLLWSMLQAGI